MPKEIEATPEEVDDNTSLEDMEVSFEDEVDESEEELEEASEDESEEETETETEEVEAEETNEEEESEASDETKSEETNDSQMSDEEKQKQHNREMAEKRIQEKKAREAAIKRQQDEYIAAAEDDTQLALRQLQVDAYKTKVTTNESSLKTGFERAMVDFPILANTSPEIQAEVDAALDTFQGLYVTIDDWGNPSEVRGDLYQYLQNKAESIERLTKIGAKQESKAKGKTKANTLTPPSRTPKQPKVDPMLEGFDEEASRW